MYDFEFIINEHFNLYGGQIGLTGTMNPDNFPIVSKDKYHIKLFSSEKIVHNFNNIGEEIPSRTSNKTRVRAFRTTDDIRDILENMNNLSIRGFKK